MPQTLNPKPENAKLGADEVFGTVAIQHVIFLCGDFSGDVDCLALSSEKGDLPRKSHIACTISRMARCLAYASLLVGACLVCARRLPCPLA